MERIRYKEKRGKIRRGLSFVNQRKFKVGIYTQHMVWLMSRYDKGMETLLSSDKRQWRTPHAERLLSGNLAHKIS